MRPYIFLDFDGVVNSALNEHSDPNDKQAWKEQIPYCFYPRCVDELRKLCENVNPIVVVSSTWRMTTTREFMVEKFGYWFDQYLAEGDDWKTPGGGGPRGPQIAKWLEGKDTRPFVVIDDEVSDIYPHQPVVHISMMMGLEEHDCLRAVEILRLKGWNPG